MTARGPVSKPIIWILSLILVGVGVDQATKAIAIATLTPGVPVRVVADLLQLQLLRNPGAAFSTGSSMTVVFSVLAVIVLIAVSVWVVPKVHSRVWAIAVGLGMAGITGNFIDRVFRAPGPLRGYVVDFFAVKYFAVFNVADIMLTAAAVLIVLIAMVFKIDMSGRRVTVGEDTRQVG
ncbi:MAG: signal peptidase II [Propionibacteriaceae bacterium]|nr:signal peptidase II [Propionibacteriaceae bacterium]